MLSGNTGTNGRRIIALAAAAVVGTVATDAMAQLQFGDAVTINSYLHSTQNGRIYRVQPNGTQTQIGAEWGWNERPLAVMVENANTVLVATGTYANASSGYGQNLYRVNVTTGDRTYVAALNRPQGIDWTYQATDFEKHPTNGKVYLSTGIPYYTTGWGTGRIHEVNTQTGQLTTIVDNLGWERAPAQMAIDPTNPNKMVFAASHQAETYESYHYTLDLTNPSGTLQQTSSRSWNERVMGLEYAADGTLYGTTGTMRNTGYTSYITTNDPNSLQPNSNIINHSGRQHGWPDQAYKLSYDETFDRLWMGGAQHRNSNGSYTVSMYYRDLATDNDVFVTNFNNSWGIVDMDVYAFGIEGTGKNDIVIGGTDANVTGSQFFYSSSPTGEIAASTLIGALSGNDAGVRTGFQNASGTEDGDVTLNADIDFNGVGNRMLTLRAHDDLTINNQISDSDAGGDNLTVVLIANNGAEAGSTGAVQVSAPLSLNGGGMSASGKTFDNTDGPITTTGNVAITTTGQTTIGAQIDGGNVTIVANGFSNTAAINATGAFSLTNSGPTSIEAPITAASMDLGSSTVDVTGLLAVAGSIGTSGTLNVQPGGSLTISSLPSDIPTINVDGGRVEITGTSALQNPGNFTFNNGVVAVAGNRTYASGNNLAQRVMGTSLTVGKTVEIGGALNLGTTYTINGGKLVVGSLLNGYNLDFRKGTLEFTAQDVEVTDGGVLGDTVILTSGQNVVASGSTNGNVNVSSDGILELAGGRLTANAVSNSGELRMNSTNSRISGGSLANDGILSGTGRVESEVFNNTTGEIRVASGNQLRFTNSVQNDGRVDVQGGTAEFASTLTNTGEVVAHNGTLRFGHGAINAVFNSGAMNITGQTNVYGDVYNAGGGGTDGGTIIVAGGATVNFYDDLYNGPNAAAGHELRVGGGSAIVVFGTYHGGGATGQGTVHMEGGFEPAYSPGAINFGGNLALGQNAETSIELAGASLGSFDQVNVAGQLILDGDLSVEFLDGYVPADGTVFSIFTASSVVGTFDNVTFSQGIWDVNYTPTGVSLTAISVPEPASLGVLAMGAAALIRRRRRVA